MYFTLFLEPLHFVIVYCKKNQNSKRKTIFFFFETHPSGASIDSGSRVRLTNRWPASNTTTRHLTSTTLTRTVIANDCALGLPPSSGIYNVLLLLVIREDCQEKTKTDESVTCNKTLVSPANVILSGSLHAVHVSTTFICRFCDFSDRKFPKQCKCWC